ncbi:MAG: sn-glycerol-3-phosphate ABC transporter ATP-binding protein UgpC [Dongiaceae bacterium]
MADINLIAVNKLYGSEVHAVQDVNLHIRDGEFMILLGPSGCGKSTTLRMIAGLEAITSGELYIGGRRMNEVDPRDRNLAIVFQNYALYPHMSVAANLSFGLRLRHRPKAEINQRVAEVAAMLGITPLLGRKPSALSGGQRQRVALGRALVREPTAFLLDEPLSNLDAKLRASMRTELVKLHRKLGVTIVHVTHDQVEAMTMGERICIMKDGRIVQVGPPLEVYRNPADTFVAGFLASPPMNLIAARVTEDAAGRLTVAADGLALPISDAAASYRAYKDRPVILGIRPEDMYDTADAGDRQPIDLRVVAIEALGPEIVLIGEVLGAGQTEIAARLGRSFNAAVGATQRLYVDIGQIRLFDPRTTRAIEPGRV